MKKRFLAMLLTLCMALSLLPMSAFATEPSATDTQQINEDAGNLPAIPAGIAIATDLDTTESGAPELTFALNFSFDQEVLSKLSKDEQNALWAAYKDYYVDFELTFNKAVELGTDTACNGYLAGEYGDWEWIKVPGEYVTGTVE